MNATGGGRPPVAPASPARGPPSAPGGGASMALTVQDPYTMTPAEQQRYESLFPQYAKDDGFMYGAEAVSLFSKSGLNQTQLRDIWNLADQPVDNKLDKLEFAIAMHMIVCVSKKNLPMPKMLPMSLKALKQQTPAPAPTPEPPTQMQQQPAGPPSISATPSYNSQHPPAAAAAAGSFGGGMSDLQGPPPIVQAGGQDISDAFEGLSTTGGDLPPPTSSYGALGGGGSFGGPATGSNDPSGAGGLPTNSSSIGQPSPNMAPTPATVPSPPLIRDQPPPSLSSAAGGTASLAPEEPPKTTESLAQSYDMTDSSGELVKLKGVLQKLQAENISLKAQLGTMSEEEKEVQKQVNATVAEIGELSNQLTTLRAQVLASKSRLLEATSELKAAQEKKGYDAQIL